VVSRDWVLQRFGSMTPVLIDSAEITEAQVLEEIAVYLLDFNTQISAEETDDGYDIIVSSSLDEDVVYHII
jgi:hypothetical protein